MKILYCGATFFLLLFGVVIPSHAGDGRLVIYNSRFNELLDVNYQSPNALTKIERIFRSPDGATHQIDIQLLELLDAIQDHFKTDMIEIISGYRSAKYNKHLKKTGHTVANESLHMHGMAADIHIDEVTEKFVWEYVKVLKAGGAGFYPDYNFVHVDVGDVRDWGEPASGQRKITGVANPSFITDKNIYFSRDINKVQFKPTLPVDASIERFVRGTWQVEVSKRLPYGKYRAVSKNGKSNEFYIKQK